KGQCHLYKADVYEHSKGILFVAIMPGDLNRHFNFEESFVKDIAEYKEALKGQLYLSATRTYLGNDDKLIFRIQQLADRYYLPVVATGDIHYHDYSRRELQDILTC